MPEPTGVVFCPVCTSTVDPTDGEHECVSCDQIFMLLDPTVSVTPEPDDADFSGVAFCPADCEPNDLIAKDGGAVVMECKTCDQHFGLTVSATRFETHAI